MYSFIMSTLNSDCDDTVTRYPSLQLEAFAGANIWPDDHGDDIPIRLSLSGTALKKTWWGNLPIPQETVVVDSTSCPEVFILYFT